MNEVGFLLFGKQRPYQTIIKVLHFQTKATISKEKVVLIFEQRTQLSFILFSGDYIPIIYITAHSYVTTCDLYPCQNISKPGEVGMKPIFDKYSRQITKGLPNLTHVRLQVTSTQHMKGNVCSVVYTQGLGFSE